MAVVYRARDLMLARPVAIKLLRESYSRSDEFRERFRQEAQSAANLSHPNIVTVHDFGLDRNRLYLVLEYIPGTDLKAILKQRGRLEVKESIDLIIQACAGIGYAHRAGLVHCDVKPHNMLVTPDGRLKVTDFGIARALASIHQDEQHQVVWGSPLYFSPEQAAGQAPSPASDVYSLGVVLYEMLTGKLPFEASDAAELARLHREVAPAPPSQLNHMISPTLEQIILKVLSKEPSARYRNAEQLGRVLLKFAQKPDPLDAKIPPLSPMPTVTSQPPMATPVQQPEIDLNPEETPASTAAPMAEQIPLQVDWGNILLGLLTLLLVGGLIPFWLYIWFSLNTIR